MALFDLWKFSKAYATGETPDAYIKRVGIETALKTFIRHGHEVGLRLCFERGLTQTFHFKTGENILQYAIRNCPEEKILRVIVEMNPEIINNKNDITGKTAMHYAAESSSVDMNRYLYVMGGRPDISDKNGLLPYYYAMNNRRANHIASVSLDVLADLGLIKLLDGSQIIKSANDAVEAAKQISETEKYINCVQSYLTRTQQK